MSQKLRDIMDCYPEEQFLKADGFDDAIVGVEENTMRLAYSVTRCVEILMADHEMEYEDAVEYFNYNVGCAYVGERTPIWINDNFN